MGKSMGKLKRKEIVRSRQCFLHKAYFNTTVYAVYNGRQTAVEYLICKFQSLHALLLSYFAVWKKMTYCKFIPG